MIDHVKCDRHVETPCATAQVNNQKAKIEAFNFLK